MTDQPHDMIQLMRPISEKVCGPIFQSHGVGKCDQSGDRNHGPATNTKNGGAGGRRGHWYWMGGRESGIMRL